MYCSTAVVVYGVRIESKEALKIKDTLEYKQEVAPKLEEWTDEDSYDEEHDCPIKWENLNEFNKFSTETRFFKAKYEFRNCDCCEDGCGEYNYYIGVNCIGFTRPEEFSKIDSESIKADIKKLAEKYSLPYDLSKMSIYYDSDVAYCW